MKTLPKVTRDSSRVISTALIVLVMMVGLGASNRLYADTLKMTVWKTPTCGCCAAWVDYLKRNDFEVTVHNMPDVTSIKQELGLTDPKLHSCHTGLIDGYVIEGHVPADDIKRLISSKPEDALGLTAPGMPMYSPGMASEIPRDYDVLQFDKAQNTSVFSDY